MNRPLHQFKAGAVSVTVWKNVEHDAAGNALTFNTITCQRSYKHRGTWRTTSTLRINDLPKAAMLLNKAYEQLVFQRGRKNSDKYAGEQNKRPAEA